jgi:hypothetical protein
MSRPSGFLGPEMGSFVSVGGLSRCVSCGEVHWNLRLAVRAEAKQECRVCGAELSDERRRPGRRFGRFAVERRDVQSQSGAAGLSGGAGS